MFKRVKNLIFGSNDSRKFAFGSNEVETTKCPVVTVNETLGSCNDVVRYYDKNARKQTEEYRGIISEEIAKEMWFEGILICLKRYHEGRASHYKYLKDARGGVKVAKELGWL